MKKEKVTPRTPLLKQYFGLKDKYPDCLLLFRVGDFYETYGEDAEIASKALNILLTAKEAGNGNKVAMAGVPYHSVTPYLRRLVKQGFKVGIAEQMEDPKEAKGLVKRDVVEVITRGTILDDELLEAGKNNFIGSLLIAGERGGLALADLSTGEFYLTGFSSPEPLKFITELMRWGPVELVLPSDSDKLDLIKEEISAQKLPVNLLAEAPPIHRAEELLKATFKLESLIGSSIENYPEAIRVSGFLIDYLRELRKTQNLSFSRFCFYNAGDHLILDQITFRHLELTRTLLSEKKEGSLLWAIDETHTPMGGRLLRKWLEMPLRNLPEISKRHQAVEELCENYRLLREVRDRLKDIKDLERLLSRIVYGAGNARDLRNFANSLIPLPEIREFLRQGESPLLKELAELFDPLTDVKELLLTAVVDNPPVTLREGGMIKPGLNAELDELMELRNSAKQSIALIERKERERTGIKSLKIGFNQVFGYYVEVTRSNLSLVPENYIRKQTLTGS